MRRLIVLFFLLTISASAQVVQTDTIFANRSADLLNKALFSDSLCSSFFLNIEKEVKAHKHEYHSEHVFIASGTGMMRLADTTFFIEKGMLVYIPKGTVHAVKVTEAPLKVVSIQAPFYNGKDRIFVE